MCAEVQLANRIARLNHANCPPRRFDLNLFNNYPNNNSIQGIMVPPTSLSLCDNCFTYKNDQWKDNSAPSSSTNI